MQNKVIKFTGLSLLFTLIIALAVACKVEAAAPSDDTSGGTTAITVTVDGGTSYTVASDGTADVPDPTKTGYDFIGWTKTKDGNSVDFVRNSTKVTTSITIYPLWDTALSSKITFTKDFTTFHAFQYQITITDLKADTNLEFIASKDAIAPSYDSIKNDGALRSAYFTPTFLKRGVYFSFKNGGEFDAKKYPVLTTVTGLYEPTNNINYINLKTKTQQADVQTAIESVSPALLSPGGTYYIHVYRNGKHVTSSLAITLKDYFTTTWKAPVANGTTFNLNDYLLGRNDFTISTTTDKAINTTYEGNNNDIIAVPLTLVLPIIDPSNSCGTTPLAGFYLDDSASLAANSPITNLMTVGYPVTNDLSKFPRIAFAPPTNFGTNYTNTATNDQYYVFDYIYLFTAVKTSHDGKYLDNGIINCPLVTTLDDIVTYTVVNLKVYDK